MIPARKSPVVEMLFHAYTRRYLQRSFHRVHRLGDPPRLPPGETAPLLVCLNHTSWWDLLLAFALSREFPDWDSYGVMEAEQLERYRFFTRLGVCGVDRSSLAGVKAFLRYAEELLRGQSRALWITPQGEMVSNLARPIRFQPGIGHLAARLPAGYVTTIALHYEFWDEKTPEAFVSFSPQPPIRLHAAGFDRRALVYGLERRLEDQLDTLLELARQRDPTRFQPLLYGQSGISPTYDAIRRLAARLRGERFSPEHSARRTPPWKERKEVQ